MRASSHWHLDGIARALRIANRRRVADKVRTYAVECLYSTSVIPAKAGIQEIVALLNIAGAWGFRIPAFGGMTGLRRE